MRLLVTRPEPEASETAARLRGLGHEVVVAPLLEIVFTAPPVDVPDPAAIILTSRNGVRALTRWPRMANWLDRPLFVAGLATADAARRAGFNDVRTAASDAADLADFLMAQLGREVRPILYPAARDRAGALSSGLGANGYDVQTIEAYSAETVATLDPAVADALRSHWFDGILLYSYRTAAAFRSLAGREGIIENLRGIVLFVLSDRIAAPLRDLGAEILVARHPDEESLFALLPRAPR